MAVPKCWTVKREECANVAVKHCEPQTRTECNTKVRIPWQEWVHQEKCLFAQDGTLSNSPTSELSRNVIRKGRLNYHNPFPQRDHHQKHQKEQKHRDEYGNGKEPEGYSTDPTLDYDLKPEFSKPDDEDARRVRNTSHFHQPIGIIINERAKYSSRMG